VVVGRRGDSRSALALCVTVCLLGTPVLHAHYFALLVVPLALFRPQFDVLWLVSLVTWLCPEKGARPWQVVVALAASTIVVGSLLQRPRDLTTSLDEDLIAPGPIREQSVAGSTVYAAMNHAVPNKPAVLTQPRQ
jgi:hypothetical protein